MLGSPVLPLALLHTWLTPFWLLSLGVALGVVVLAIVYGVLHLVWRPAADFMQASIREGILLPIFYLALFLTGFAVLATFLVPGIPYQTAIDSVARLSKVGTQRWDFTVPPSTTGYSLEDLKVPLSELAGFTSESDQPITIDTNIRSHLGQMLGVRVEPGTQSAWQKPYVLEKKPDVIQDQQTDWTATNTGSLPAKLQITTTTDIEMPQVRAVPITAACLIGLLAVYVGLRLLSPKVSAIALTTAREAMSQPLYYLALGLGCCGLVAFIFIPYNTFGEDIKMLKDSGLIWIMVWGIIVAVWSASVSVSEEVEGRTALTVLSKPVKRRQFILGKFFGVLGPVVVLFLVLGFLFLLTVCYKVVYDARNRQERAALATLLPGDDSHRAGPGAGIF